MAGFGDRGSRPGGFGTSFPSRGGAPNSQVVDYLRPQDEWEADWNARRAEEANRARGPSLIADNPGPRPDAPTGSANWSDSTGFSSGWGAGVDPNAQIATDQSRYGAGAMIPSMGWSMTTGADPNYHPDAPTASWGMTMTPNGGPGTFEPNENWSAGYTPDFSALDREREQMMGRYDAQARNTQAYGWMNGGNQTNGILSADYANPGFNQINTAGGTGAGPEVPAGVNMDWTGVYNPQTGSGAVGQARRGWGQ